MTDAGQHIASPERINPFPAAAVARLSEFDPNPLTVRTPALREAVARIEAFATQESTDSADKNSIGKTTINGTTFTAFHAADAGMNHYLKVHSLRTVHGGYCYAIDLLVTGTNPEVYDPPRKPPFSQEAAFKQLEKALQGFRFTR